MPAEGGEVASNAHVLCMPQQLVISNHYFGMMGLWITWLEACGYPLDNRGSTGVDVDAVKAEIHGRQRGSILRHDVQAIEPNPGQQWFIA